METRRLKKKVFQFETFPESKVIYIDKRNWSDLHGCIFSSTTWSRGSKCAMELRLNLPSAEQFEWFRRQQWPLRGKSQFHLKRPYPYRRARDALHRRNRQQHMWFSPIPCLLWLHTSHHRQIHTQNHIQSNSTFLDHTFKNRFWS